MARYVCEYGHVGADGQPVTHPSHRFCDRWVRADRERKRGAAPAAAAGPAPAAGSGPAPAAGAAAPGRTPIREGSGFSVGFRPATHVDVDATGAEATLEFELTKDQSERFWTAGFGLVGTILNGLCKLLKIKELPADTFVLDEGQKYVFREGLRGLTTTIVVKVFRAKTPQEADRVIAAINGIAAFGGLAFKVIVHFVTEVPKSPYFEKWKKGWAELKAKRDAARTAAADRAAAPGAPAPPALPAGATA